MLNDIPITSASGIDPRSFERKPRPGLEQGQQVRHAQILIKFLVFICREAASTGFR
jgi:hypothetical protein